MSTENKQLCMGCMEYIDEGADVCPHCGYVKNFDGNIKYSLPTDCVINDRYIFGASKFQDGEGIVYIALDKVAGEKVYIKEFAPFSICNRGEDKYSISAKIGCEVKFKALYFDYKELCANISELSSSSCIVPLIDFFEKNGTIYSVYKYINAMTLEQYLRYNGGSISWIDAKKLFRPIFSCMEIIEDKDLLHRGISPETILIESSGKVYLSGFSIASNRTCFSEIPETIQKYYGAPEQYEASGWQGTWTDVFGLSATLFRVLTGNTPLEASELIKGRRSPNPNFINPSIPQNVSDAILNGMIPDTKERTQSCSLFVEQLLGCVGGNTTVFNPDDLKAKATNLPKNEVSSESDGKSSSKGLIIGAILAVIFIVGLAFAINSYIFPKSNQEENSQANVPTEYVPLFVGKQANTFIGNASMENKFNLKFVYEFNSDIPDGQIYKQEPSVSTPIPVGSDVTLYVSRGANKLIIPVLIGEEVPVAMQILDEVGIKYCFETAEKVYAEEKYKNTIYATEPVAGTEIDVDRDMLTLIIFDDEENSSEFEDIASSQDEATSES